MVVLPLVCISLLTTYNINSAITRESANLKNRGENLLSLAANAAELALFAGDVTSLNTLRSAIVHDSQIANVLFFDEDQVLITEDTQDFAKHISEENLVDENRHIDGDFWYFSQAVKLSNSAFEEDQEQYITPADSTTLGWVMLVVDLGESHAYQTRVLKNNLLVAVILLSVFLWLTLRFSRSVVGPITNITAALGRYGNEDFSQRVDELSPGELGNLEKGINNLAERVEQSQQILKDEVNKATKDLEEKNVDLAAAKEAADAANVAKDDFLARMSHELRTPLTGIMGFTRLLAKTKRDALRKEYSDMIITSSSVLLSTINDILDFSKLRANSFSLNPVPFNLEDSLRDVVDLHRVAAFEKAIELNVLIDSDVSIEIFADIDKLQKVVNNLIGNAVKFTPTGDIVLFVSLVKQEGNEALISISVKDSGVGIGKEDMKYLFDPFYQSDASNTRRHDGTGLGLAIAEDFVTLLGGDVSIDSDEGQGTEVEFTFRCITMIDAPENHPRPDSLQAVIFDNNPWTRRSWRNQLLKYSDDVCAPTSPDDLIANLGVNTDVLLLGFNYYDSSLQQAESMLKRIRAAYKGSIVVAAADDGNAPFDPLRESYGPLMIISKPLTNNRLLSALREVNPNLRAELGSGTANPAHIKSLNLSSSKDITGLELLIAEDNKFNQTLLARLLEAAGAKVTLASDGMEALKYTEAQRYDVLVVDLHMPGLNGMQLSSAIRSAVGQANANTPILLLTADVLSQQEPEILAAGVDAISYKPIDEDDLIGKIQSLAAKQSNTDPDSKPRVKRALITLDADQISAEVARLLLVIEQALATNDREALTDQAHQLKGMIGLSGLEHIKDLAQALDTAAKTQDFEGANECFAALAKSWRGAQA
jgi:two-component system sensor histidine kinase BarA